MYGSESDPPKDQNGVEVWVGVVEPEGAGSYSGPYAPTARFACVVLPNRVLLGLRDRLTDRQWIAGIHAPDRREPALAENSSLRKRMGSAPPQRKCAISRRGEASARGATIGTSVAHLILPQFPHINEKMWENQRMSSGRFCPVIDNEASIDMEDPWRTNIA